MQKLSLILLVISTYVGWFACVYLGREGLGVYTIAIPLVAWILFFRALKPSRLDCQKLFGLTAVGLVLDSLLSYFREIVFVQSADSAVLPIWMISLWLLFAPSLVLLKNTFGRRYLIAALAGAVFGPLTYKSGESLGVMTLAGVSAIAIYSVIWAIYLPGAIFWLNQTAEDKRHANS